MNSDQKTIVIGALLLIAGMALYPPHEVVFQSTATRVMGSSSTDEFVTYAPAWSPPERGFHDDGEITTLSGRVHEVNVDMGRLAIQWAVVLAAAGIFFVMASPGTPEEHS